MNMRRILIWLVPMAVLALLAVLLILRLDGREQASGPANWPTQDRQGSTPEEQGIDSEKLAEALLTMRERNINIQSAGHPERLCGSRRLTSTPMTARLSMSLPR
jgi:hypothetical protein